MTIAFFVIGALVCMFVGACIFAALLGVALRAMERRRTPPSTR